MILTLVLRLVLLGLSTLGSSFGGPSPWENGWIIILMLSLEKNEYLDFGLEIGSPWFVHAWLLLRRSKSLGKWMDIYIILFTLYLGY